MSVIVDDQLILHLEKLSKLKLNATERAEIKDELFNILGMFEALENIDENQLGEIAKMVENGIDWRADEVADQLTVENALKNAPQKSGPFFIVPKFIETN